LAVGAGPAAVGAGPSGPPAVKPWADLGVESGFLTDDVPCEDYVEQLAASACYRLTVRLRMAPAVGGIDLQGPLHRQAPLRVAETLKGMQSYKEHWRWCNCKKSLSALGLYGAPGNLFWFAVAKPTWLGQGLPAATLTYAQMGAGRTMWSDEKFLRSHDDPNKRHYLLDESMPTAITGLSDLPENCPDNEVTEGAAVGAMGFSNLPCLGSRACLAGFYSVLDDALRANDGNKIKKLYMAALSMPMRMRVAPTFKQVILDSVSYSEQLFAAKLATSDSFFDWCDKVVTLLGAYSTAAVGDMPVKDVQKQFEQLGVTYHGVKTSDNVVRALQNCAPYVIDEKVRTAYKDLENVNSVLNDQTKFAQLVHAATKAYGKATEAAVGAVCKILISLRHSLMYKDITATSHVTKEFLSGGRQKAIVTKLFT